MVITVNNTQLGWISPVYTNIGNRKNQRKTMFSDCQTSITHIFTNDKMSKKYYKILPLITVRLAWLELVTICGFCSTKSW